MKPHLECFLAIWLSSFGCQVALAGDYPRVGTIVVVAHLGDRIFIAADSRVGNAKDGASVTGTNDGYCKIATFESRVAFSASGVLSDSNANWTATVEFMGAAAGLRQKQIGSDAGRGILRAWYERMKNRLSAFSKEQLLARSRVDGGDLTTGILAGADGRDVWLRALTIGYQEQTGFRSSEFELTIGTKQEDYFYLGKSAVAKEFKESNSAQAIRERKSWGRRRMSRNALHRFIVRRLVELTIIHHPAKKDVGGPVDEIEIDASGAHWIQAKPQCK